MNPLATWLFLNGGFTLVMFIGFILGVVGAFLKLIADLRYAKEEEMRGKRMASDLLKELERDKK